MARICSVMMFSILLVAVSAITLGNQGFAGSEGMLMLKRVEARCPRVIALAVPRVKSSHGFRHRF